MHVLYCACSRCTPATLISTEPRRSKSRNAPRRAHPEEPEAFPDRSHAPAQLRNARAPMSTRDRATAGQGSNDPGLWCLQLLAGAGGQAEPSPLLRRRRRRRRRPPGRAWARGGRRPCWPAAGACSGRWRCWPRPTRSPAGATASRTAPGGSASSATSSSAASSPCTSR